MNGAGEPGNPVLSVEIRTLAAQVVAALRRLGATVATAESLTGGLVVAALTTIPGASAVVRGGICAYHADVKAEMVGVSAQALRHGAVNARVAEELAVGCRSRMRADYGIGTTGVAGPDPSDGCEVGTVYIAVAGRTGGSLWSASRRMWLSGDRESIRQKTVQSSLDMLAQRLAR